MLKSRLWKPSFGITALNDQEIREVSFFEGLAVSGNFDVYLYFVEKCYKLKQINIKSTDAHVLSNKVGVVSCSRLYVI